MGDKGCPVQADSASDDELSMNGLHFTAARIRRTQGVRLLECWRQRLLADGVSVLDVRPSCPSKTDFVCCITYLLWMLDEGAGQTIVPAGWACEGTTLWSERLYC